jgi:hypothetical protein
MWELRKEKKSVKPTLMVDISSSLQFEMDVWAGVMIKSHARYPSKKRAKRKERKESKKKKQSKKNQAKERN